MTKVIKNKTWHDKHRAVLKKRKHIRSVHMLSNRIKIAKRIEVEKKTQEQIDNPGKNVKHRSRLSWLLLRTQWVITDFFRRMISKFRLNRV